MKRKLLLFLLALLSIHCSEVAAQGFTVTGQVIDDEFKEPMVGVNIRQKNADGAVVTDIDGNFQIKIDQDEATLVFTYVGMLPLEQRVTAKDKQPLKIVMKSETTKIEELVVVAYGTRKKGTVTGSVSVVKGDVIADAPVASFDQALQGKATGLTVLQNSGEPSAPASFQIRGTNSINADTQPLFILDGVPISASDFASINPNDIENFSILKDASSTSIYGARAANGVVVITTKRGTIGDKAKISVRAQYGVSNLAYGKWNQMNTTQRLDFEEMVGIRIPGTYDRETLERTNINWKDVVFNDAAPTQSYEMNVSGGQQKMNYYISTGYFSQQGTALDSDFDRITLRANLEAQATNWLKIGTNTALTYSSSHEADYGSYSVYTPISAARFMLPYWNPYKEDGSLTSAADGSWIGSNDNPLSWLAANPMKTTRMQIVSSAYLEISPIKDLKLRTMIGVDGSDSRTNTTSLPSYVANYGSGAAAKSFSRNFNLTWTNTANYTHTIKDKNHFNFLLGHEITKNGYDQFSVTTQGQSNDELLTLGTGVIASGWSDNDGGATYVSLFARAEYDYGYKYFADFSIRRDASSRFGKDARWANFWSVGAMWSAKREDWLMDVAWLSNAQLSASYGTSGNSSIPNYDHLSLFAAGPQYAGMTGIAPYSRGNNRLTWEKLGTFNLGLKLGFFDRIDLGIEFYNKKTTDMLMEVPITLGNGFNTIWENVGAMVNRGVEFDMNVNLLNLKGFVWNVNGNASFNHNEITELYNGQDEYEITGANIMLKVGHPYGEHYAVRYAGVNPANGDALWYTKEGKLTNEYNEEDKVLLGKSSVAPWQGGFGTTLSYKGISLSAQFSWVKNRWMLNNDRFFDESNGMYSSSFNQSNELFNGWQKPGDRTDIPRYGVTPQFDSHLLEEASFLRLKNLTLAYSFPEKWLKKTQFFQSARLFLQGQNLLTFTPFTGMDPESSSAVYSAAYPMSRQFTIGAELSF